MICIIYKYSSVSFSLPNFSRCQNVPAQEEVCSILTQKSTCFTSLLPLYTYIYKDVRIYIYKECVLYICLILTQNNKLSLTGGRTARLRGCQVPPPGYVFSAFYLRIFFSLSTESFLPILYQLLCIFRLIYVYF